MSTAPIAMTAPPDVYAARRARLAAGLQRPLAIFAGRARPRTYAANYYPFRAGSNYLYFGGPPLEGAAILVEPGSDGRAACLLFRQRHMLEDAVWTGERPGDDDVSQASGLPLAALREPDALAAALGHRTGAFVAPPCGPTRDWIRTLDLQPANEEELRQIVGLRIIKDDHEIRAMRGAADAAVQAHLAAMESAAPGRSEAEVAAALLAVLVAFRCDVSFTPTVTIHGEVLHCDGFPHALEAGQLLLVDAGAEEGGGYASDVTRACPVSGQFTPVQRHIYDTVRRAQQAAIAACTPGRRFRDVHDLAGRVLCEGLVAAGLLRGDPQELAARGAHTLFFTHGLGHLLGLDVHDMEDFGDVAGYAPGRTRRTQFGSKFLRFDRDLETGMTLTIEPGIYLVPAIWKHDELVAPFADVVNRRAVDALLADHFGGIRIEDDVLVRDVAAGGPDVLTADLPSDADAVAAIVAGSHST